jgi:hypothetical protein
VKMSHRIRAEKIEARLFCPLLEKIVLVSDFLDITDITHFLLVQSFHLGGVAHILWASHLLVDSFKPFGVVSHLRF